MDEIASKKRTYEICIEAALRYPCKRKLVTLFEANEVAKRLARKNTQSPEANAVEKHKDEVDVWAVSSIQRSLYL